MKFLKEKGERDLMVRTNSDKDAISSILGKDLTVEGDVSFLGKVRVDGTIQGNVKGEYLILSESGKITGDVAADCFLCHGTVEGNIGAKRLAVQKTATITGNVDADEFSVDAGAALRGAINASTQDLRLVHDSSAQASRQEEARS